MPDPWLEGATRNPGLNAGYRLGKSSMDKMHAHATVGRDSRRIGEDGYFNILVHKEADRENGCTQYAEIDGVTWHAYEPHRLYGPGVEFERMPMGGGINEEGLTIFEPLTLNQIEWGNRIVKFCAEWNIPANLYDGPRYGSDGWRGWVNHHDVDSSRSDGLTRAEWDLVAVGAPIPRQEGSLMWAVYYPNEDGSVTFIHGIGAVVAFRLVGAPVAPYGLPMGELNYIKFDFNGVTTKMVTAGVGDNLEKASAKLLA